MTSCRFACVLSLLLVTASMADVGIHIEEASPDRTIAWPMSAAVALPQEYCDDAGALSLVDARGRNVAASIDVVARWRPSEHIKWLNVRFVDQAGAGPYQLVKRAAPRAEQLPMRRDGEAYVVDNAGVKLRIARDALAVHYNGQPIATGLDHYIVKQGSPQRIGATFDAIEVERHDANEITFLLTGRYDDSAHLLLRVTLHRDVPVVFFDHTFRFMGDLDKDVYTDIAAAFTMPSQSQRSVALDGKTFTVPRGGSLSMAQENVIHINNNTPLKSEHGRSDYYGIYANNELLHDGERSDNTVAFDVSGEPVAATLKWFWQSFPKEWQIADDTLTLHLFSPRGGDLAYNPTWREKWIGDESIAYNRKRYAKYDVLRASDPKGADKRHHFQLAFGDAAKQAPAFAERPPVAHVDPKWLCDAGPFLQPIVPANLDHPNQHIRTLERSTSKLFDVMLEAVDRTGGYGFFEQGHGHHYSYEWNDDADRLFIGFYRFMNHDYFVRRNLWMNYFRSGDRKYVDYLIPRMEHFLDVEVAHADARNNIPDGSWSKDMWYWENWQNAFERTYQVSARGIVYYLARTGDPRARWQLEQWRQWFLKKDDVAAWAEEHQMWGGAKFSAWRVPVTTIGNLLALYEVFGDQKLLDMAVAVMRAFEDKNSPSGTEYIWSANKYEYTMWEKGEYYRIPRFNECVRISGDAELAAMRDKLLRYWMHQRADEQQSCDQVPVTLYWQQRDPDAAAMLKTYIEDPQRQVMLDKLNTPIGPEGPQGYLHPSNTIRLMWFTYPCLVAVYDNMLAEGTDGLLNRFERAGLQRTWVGEKRSGKAFVMQLIAPGRDARMTFVDEKGIAIDARFVERHDFVQQAPVGSHVIFTVKLPADHAAQQVWTSGDLSFVVAGSEKTYLFDPGSAHTAFSSDKAKVWFRLPKPDYALQTYRVGGNAEFKLDRRDNVIGIEGDNVHWRAMAGVDLRELQAAQRFMAIGDPAGLFDPAPANVSRFAQRDDAIDRPNAKQAFVPGVSGQAYHVNDQRALLIDHGQLPADEGTLEFWFMPLWDVRFDGQMLAASNILTLNVRKADEIFTSLRTTDEARGAYTVMYPERAGVAMRPGKWYHIAIGWKTLDKPKRPFQKGGALSWMTIDGELQPQGFFGMSGNEKRNFDKPLIIGASAGHPYLIDELRISKTNRYLENKKNDDSPYGGFDLDTVRPPQADDDTLLLLHFDGNLDAQPPYKPREVPGDTKMWP